MEAVKSYIKELSEADKEQNRDILVKFSQSKRIQKGDQRCFNGGYLFLQAKFGFSASAAGQFYGSLTHKN